MHRKQTGFSLIELLIVVAIILVIAAIAIPNLIQARIRANEASAVSGVRSIATAQISYQILNSSYAATLVELGSSGSGLLPDSIAIAPNQHSGYTFSATGTSTGFTASAVPSAPGNTGIRSFCSDTPAVIYFSPTESGCVPGTSAPLQ